ncbi:MAG: DUF5309 domain-containing protein [Ramlibacter sp.]|nr:DUF5309 domain-containing protein [Ramlibacter sp.]
MTAPTNTFQTYQAVGNREDLSDIIHDISPTATPFVSALEKVVATSTKHEWQTKSLTAASGSNAVIEGDDATTDASNATVRRYNYTQISDKVAQVSGTQDVVKKAGRKSEMGMQMVDKMKELKRDQEVVLLQNVASVAGGISTPRKSAGAMAWIRTNVSKAADGTLSTGDGTDIYTTGTARALVETFTTSALALAWDAGGEPTMGILGKFQKMQVAQYSGSSTKTSNGDAKKVTNSVDVYVDPLGNEIKFVPCRQAPTGAVMMFDMEHVKLAVLRDYETSPLAKTGDSERKQILTEYCLEMGNEAAHAAVYDLTTA